MAFFLYGNLCRKIAISYYSVEITVFFSHNILLLFFVHHIISYHIIQLKLLFFHNILRSRQGGDHLYMHHRSMPFFQRLFWVHLMYTAIKISVFNHRHVGHTEVREIQHGRLFFPTIDMSHFALECGRNVITCF